MPMPRPAMSLAPSSMPSEADGFQWPGLLTFALAVLTVAGCSEPRYPVSGRVVFDDGVGYSGGGTVVFEAGEGLDRIMALAVIQPDGAFKTAAEYKGLPKGTYQVRLVGPSPDLPDEVPGLDDPMKPAGNSRIPPPKPLQFDKKFLDFQTSGLSVNVGRGLKDMTIHIGPKQ